MDGTAWVPAVITILAWTSGSHRRRPLTNRSTPPRLANSPRRSKTSTSPSSSHRRILNHLHHHLHSSSTSPTTGSTTIGWPDVLRGEYIRYAMTLIRISNQECLVSCTSNERREPCEASESSRVEMKWTPSKGHTLVAAFRVDFESRRERRGPREHRQPPAENLDSVQWGGDDASSTPSQQRVQGRPTARRGRDELERRPGVPVAAGSSLQERRGQRA